MIFDLTSEEVSEILASLKCGLPVKAGSDSWATDHYDKKRAEAMCSAYKKLGGEGNPEAAEVL